MVVDGRRTLNREEWSADLERWLAETFQDPENGLAVQWLRLEELRREASAEGGLDPSAVTEAAVFAALAEAAGNRAGGLDQVVVECWKALSIQSMLLLASQIRKYLCGVGPSRPQVWARVLLVALPKEEGAASFGGFRWIALIATLAKWVLRVITELLRQWDAQHGPPRRWRAWGFERHRSTRAIVALLREVAFISDAWGRSGVIFQVTS